MRVRDFQFQGLLTKTLKSAERVVVYCASNLTSSARTQRQQRRASVSLALAWSPGASPKPSSLTTDHTTPPPPPPPPTATDHQTASRLSQLTIPELRQRLKESGLSVGGSKAQLVERLLTQRDQPTDSRGQLRRTATGNPTYRRAQTRMHGSHQESPADSG